MAPYSQDRRIGRFETPLGTDELVLTRFEGTEGMNELFEFRFEAISAQPDIDFDQAIGKHCSLTLTSVDGKERYFDGILTETQWMGARGEGYSYRLILRPWLWLLSKQSDCFIFHEMTAPDIISQIFGKHGGLAKFEQTLTKSYPTLEYVVQYRESDMAFVCRLMEQHGISYHFKHKIGEHTLVMGDGMPAFEPVVGTTRPFIAVEAHHNRDVEHFYAWTPERRFTTGKVTLNDYDFKKPSKDMKAEKTGDAGYEHADLEHYDYPGKYVEKGDGENYTQVKLDTARTSDGRFVAAGDCATCYPGSLMTLEDHPQGSQNQEYLTLRCAHSFISEAYRSVGSAGINTGYHGSFEFMVSSKQYAPAIVTEKPFIRGPQTAKVVGEGEIDCDEHGRILVRFHWDRETDQSRRVRVAQVWASKQWGGIFIPRIGMEVIVHHLEGDPDQPIITGCVYNGDNKPPYSLPGKKNIAGWKSNSTLGGGGYNEFIFDDTKGDELVRLHAEYDMESKIEHDERRHVVNDRTTNIDHDETKTVGHDETNTIEHDQTETINNNRSVTVAQNDTLDVGREITVTAGQRITLRVGASSIVMDPTSVTIVSPTVAIQGTQQFKTSAGMFSEHSAGVEYKIQATVVKIN